MQNNSDNIRRFTLRISQSESDRINELKDLLHETTDTGVIKKLISNYKKLDCDYKEEKQKNAILNKSINDLQKRIRDFMSSFYELGAKAELPQSTDVFQKRIAKFFDSFFKLISKKI